MIIRRLFPVFILCSCLPLYAAPAWLQPTLQQLGPGALLIEDERGRTVASHRASESFIPASILKLATGACALQTLPHDFRFRTQFYRSGQTLYVKGLGDPALTSEELILAVDQMARAGLTKVERLIIDNSYFSPNLSLDGEGSSLNPYHAKPSAFMVNFNAINFRKHANGQVESAEPQTPTVPLTKSFARGLKPGKYHLNMTARGPERALRYAGELLIAFLRQAGIQVNDHVDFGPVPAHAQLLLSYESSKTLADNVQAMLKYSNNIIANHLMLFLGIAQHGAPATAEKGLRALDQCVTQHFGWRDVSLGDGAGLSRNNRVSAAQMMDLLRHFDQHEALLPLERKLFRAKTGTLNGVSTLAGYVTTPQDKRYRFVIMMNGKHASYEAKFTTAQRMYEALAQHSP